MRDAMNKVAEFHRAFDQPIAEKPSLLSDHRRALRERLLREEFEEYLRGSGSGDLREIADGLADMIVVICGTALEHGLDLAGIFSEVHDSNMSKLGSDGPIYREDGKILKGPNFRPPNLDRFIGDFDGSTKS